MSKMTIGRRLETTAEGRAVLKAWVSETSNNIPAEIFVYQRRPLVPKDTAMRDIFVHIASYADVVDFPVNGPDEYSPFFRKGFLNLIFDSATVLEEKWELMTRQFKVLVEDIARLNGLPPVEFNILDLE